MDSQPLGIQDTQSSFDIAQFKRLYHTFDYNTLKMLPTLYSQSIVFKDPIHQLTGIESLTRYFASFCNPDTRSEFEFVTELVTNDQAFFQWKMRYSHPKLNGGKQLLLDGGTLIKFNSNIIYHEDFYDMGAMIYQHVPILGWAVKKINQRMQEQSS